MYSPKQKMSNFLDCPESFWIVWKVSGLSGEFEDCLENFWIIRTVCRLSRQFLDCPESFWIIWTVSRLSRQFLDCPESFWIIQTHDSSFSPYPCHWVSVSNLPSFKACELVEQRKLNGRLDFG